MTRVQFEAMHGFPNQFFGWGGEDDDAANRVIDAGYAIQRREPEVRRYKMLKHKADPGNPRNAQR